ncbi:hypothetical protein CC2G_005057 [Coprinopsis cinerea AmutBmut pab1-1]|nr:hypothetical protein CC2G_005057 [Coprinopsis cinerea AmutBmut pab1-1]
MQSTALRIAARSLAAGSQRAVVKRSLATAATTHAEAAATATSSPARNVAPVPLSNIEASWAKLSEAEQAAVHEQLEAIQVKDWKELSIDEKKAAYYVAFGPHGPRAPTHKSGDTAKILLGVAALLGVSLTVNFAVRSSAPPPPKSMSTEWQEASNERAKEMKIDPISGISAEDYKGKGFVSSL